MSSSYSTDLWVPRYRRPEGRAGGGIVLNKIGVGGGCDPLLFNVKFMLIADKIIVMLRGIGEKSATFC